MALRVWLPLNGTLENKGISDVTVTNNGTTIDNNGKIGKCYSFGTNKYLRLDNYATTFLTYNEFSLSVWFKCTAQNTAHQGSALISAGNWNKANSLLILALGGSFSTDHYTRLLVSGSGTWSNGYDYNFYLNQWYNVVLTSGNGKVRAYVNGELIGDSYSAFKPASLEQNWVCIGNGTYTQIFHFIGLMNDVRIYDHCLSPKEVKEISQGLVLHYKLDGWSGGSGENLVWNSNWNKNSTSPPESWTNWGSPPTREIVQINNKYWLHVISNTTQFQGYSQNWTKRAGFGEISAGEILTVSFTAYLASAASIAPIGIHWCNTSSTIVSQVWTTTSLTATPTRYSFTYTTPADCAGFNIMVGDNTNTAHEIWITDIKVERGSVATPWSPAPQDLGIDTTKVTDSSGYGNDGTIIGTLSTESDSDRYEISTKSLNGTDCIKSPLSLVDVQSFTCSFWVKPSSSNGGYSILASNYNNPSSGFWISTNCEGHALWFYNQAYADTTTANISNDVWHHCAIVCDNKTFSMYIDGVLQTLNRTTSSSKTITINNLSVFNSYTGTSWNTKRYGNISDFRIYATALSAEDILDLYHTSANIDNLGELHSFELKEDINGRELLALPWTSSFGTHNKTSLWTEFNENGEWTSSIYSSSGSDYIKINPTGKTYYYDTEISVAAGNQFYIGFERYDASKTARSNQACVYVIAIKPSTDINHQRYFGTVNLATDGVNPTDTIALRILNAWSGTDSTSTKKATIHYLSLREVTGTPQTNKIFKNGQDFTDEFVQRDGIASVYQNGTVGASNFIEK